jgi:hypothetical protein
LGIEYELRVPESARESVADTLERELPRLLQRLDPKAAEAIPNVIVRAIPAGVYVCDTLIDKLVAAQVIRGLLDILLRHCQSVEVVEP